MAVTIIPNVTNWTVTPQNGQAGYFTLMNTWLGQSTSVIQSLYYAIEAQNIANSEINDLAIEVQDNVDIAVAAKDEAVGALAILSDGAIDDTNIETNKSFSNSFILNSLFSSRTEKTTPADADIFAIGDVTSSFSLKKLSWSDIKSALFETSVSTPLVSTGNVNYKSTPIAITSWSYAGTTITLNVSSHTFVAGDYIEVSGLTSTTYPANGIHLVTSVTSSTILFTLSNAPTGTAGVSSASVKGYTTINGRVSESLGINQTSQNVTGSRATGITYTNTTGKPIEVSISVAATGNGTLTFKLNNITTIQTALVTGAATEIIKTVPNNFTYSISGDASFNILQWFELR